MARPVGPCHICGRVGPLSFEHVPPESAFNRYPVIRADFERLVNTEPGARIRGKPQQRGAGDYTLCEPCNNNTGRWYVPAFGAWTEQGMRILINANRDPRLIYPLWVRPLRVIKQIITMFFSVNAPAFQAAHPELVRFVFNRREKGLASKYRVYCYFMSRDDLRHFGLTVGTNFETGRMTLMTEISFPPFGYLMTISSPPPDPRLCEITQFVRYGYDEDAFVNLAIPALSTAARLPGDYRSYKEVLDTYRKNVAAKAAGKFDINPSEPREREKGERLTAQLKAVTELYERES